MRSAVRGGRGVLLCVKRIHVQEIFLRGFPEGRPRPRGRLPKGPNDPQTLGDIHRGHILPLGPCRSDTKFCAVHTLDWQILEGPQPAPPVQGEGWEPWERSRSGQRPFCTEQLEYRLSHADGHTDEASNPPTPLLGLGVGRRLAQQAGKFPPFLFTLPCICQDGWER